MVEAKIAVRVPPLGDEKTCLHVALRRQRDAIVWKLDDVSEADARRPMVPSGTSWDGKTVSMRWVLLHMVEETARHAGHADIVRELIDGTTGDHNYR